MSQVTLDHFERLMQPLREPPHLAFAEPLSRSGSVRDPAAARAFEAQAVKNLGALTTLLKRYASEGSYAADTQITSTSSGSAFGVSKPLDHRAMLERPVGEDPNTSRPMPSCIKDELMGVESPVGSTTTDMAGRGRPNVLIEEIESTNPKSTSELDVPVEDLLLICGLYCKDSIVGQADGTFESATGSGSAGASLPYDSFLYNGWAPPAVQAAAAELYCAIAEHYARSGIRTCDGGRAHGHGMPENVRTEVLISTANAVLRRLAKVLAHPHVGGGKMESDMPDTGPSAHQRFIAARQVSWLLGQLPAGTLSCVRNSVTPILLGTGADVSSNVQFQLLWGVHRLLTGLSLSELGDEQQLWLQMLHNVLLSSDDALWPFAARTACTAAQKFQGTDKSNFYLHQLAKQLLAAAQRFWDSGQREYCLIFLHEAFIFPSLGLQTVRYFSSLMPLLLEMMRSPDKELRHGAVYAVAPLVRATWPRMKDHTTPLRSALAEVQRHLFPHLSIKCYKCPNVDSCTSYKVHIHVYAEGSVTHWLPLCTYDPLPGHRKG
eukprot:jgi/Botrbrau1/20245/Bobra.31_1s0036.2